MTLEIPIDAVPQGRVRVYNKIGVDPPKSRKFKEDLKTLVKSLRRESAFKGELAVELHIYRTLKVTSKRYGDIDNLAKSILDGLTGVLWIDDKQISSLLVTKNQADTPKLIVEVREVK